MLSMYRSDRWQSVALESKNLTLEQKQDWLQKIGALSDTKSEPNQPNLTNASSKKRGFTNLKGLVCDYWQAFPDSDTKETCENLGISYEEKKQVLWNYRSELRHKLGLGKVPKVSKKAGHGVHKGEWKGFVPRDLDRESAEQLGWGQSSNRNKMMWFHKDGSGIGTIFWYVNGRVRLVLRDGYVNEGHAKQLFCNGFRNLIADDEVLCACLSSLRHVRGHFAVNTRKRLPNMRVKEFQESHGISVTLGDRSHPEDVEIQYTIPNWVRPLEKILDELCISFISGAQEGRNKEPGESFYVV